MSTALGRWKARQLAIYGLEWERSLPREVWIVQYCKLRRVYATYEETKGPWNYLKHNGRCDYGMMEQWCHGAHSRLRGQDEIPVESFRDRLRSDMLSDPEIRALWDDENAREDAAELAALHLPDFAPLPSAVPMPGVVYVLEAEGTERWKIGRSVAAHVRLETLQTACPYPLRLLHEFQTDDTAALETALHRRYAKYRKCGEWFELPWPATSDLLCNQWDVPRMREAAL